MKKGPPTVKVLAGYSGDRGIRTLDILWGYTHFLPTDVGTASSIRVKPALFRLNQFFYIFSALFIFNLSFPFKRFRPSVKGLKIEQTQWSFGSCVLAQSVKMFGHAAIQVIALTNIKRKIPQALKDINVKLSSFHLRRPRDSNPRYPLGVYTLSRRASSTTRAGLHWL